MTEDQKDKTARSHKANPRLTRKEFYSERVQRLYLMGKTHKEIVDEIKFEYDHRLDIRTVAKYIKEALSGYESKREEMALKITAIELQKINNLESEFWAGYERSKRVVKTKKTKVEPLDKDADPDAPAKSKRGRKPKNAPPVIPGYRIVEEVREEKEQNGDVKFLLGVQWCIEQRLALLGHSGAGPNVIDPRKKKEGEEEPKPKIPGQRIIKFTVNGGTEETPSTDASQ